MSFLDKMLPFILDILKAYNIGDQRCGSRNRADDSTEFHPPHTLNIAKSVYYRAEHHWTWTSAPKTLLNMTYIYKN